MKFTHDLIERKTMWLVVLVLLTVSVGGLVEIGPLFFQRATTAPASRSSDAAVATACHRRRE